MNCPSCGGEFSPGTSECAECEVELVEGPSTAFPSRPVARFPRLLGKRPFLLELAGVALLLVGIVTLLQVVFGQNPGGLTGSLASGLPPTPAFLVESIVAVVCLIGGAGVFADRSWSRPLLLGTVVMLSVLTAGTAWTEVAWWWSMLPGPLFATWYLFLWPNAVDYYRSIARQGEAA